MKREFHVRFCERLKGKFLQSTRLYLLKQQKRRQEEFYEEL